MLKILAGSEEDLGVLFLCSVLGVLTCLMIMDCCFCLRTHAYIHHDDFDLIL